MNSDVQSWLGEVPWLPLGAVLVAVILFAVSAAGRKKRTALLATKLAAGALVIDVRSPGEFASGHYSGAQNIPVDNLADRTKKLGATDRPLVVYCASGARSARAAALLRTAGFTDVTDAGPLGNLPQEG